MADDDSSVEDLGIELRQALARHLARHDVPAAWLDALDDAEALTEPFQVRQSSDLAGLVRDRAVWLASPAVSRRPKEVAGVIGATRHSVHLITGKAVSAWPSGEGTEVLTQALAVPRVATTGSRSAVLAELTHRLQAEGLTVHEGLGHGPHAIDLAVAGQDPARLLVAVDLDADTQESYAAPGRDRVRLRHEQLSRMGWSPLRVRSTDIFTDPAREVARVLEAVRVAEQKRSAERTS